MVRWRGISVSRPGVFASLVIAALIVMAAACGAGPPQVVATQPGDLDGVAAEAAVMERIIGGGVRYPQALTSGSVQHEAWTDDDDVRLDLFTWKATFEDGRPQRCWGTSTLRADGGGGGGAGCRDADDRAPQVLLGGGGGAVGDGAVGDGAVGGEATSTWHAALLDAPVGAARFVVELADERRIESNVVGPASTLVWTGGWSVRPVRSVVFDAEGAELRTEEHDLPQPPVLPDLSHILPVAPADD